MRRVDIAHRQPDAPLAVDLEHLDADDVAFAQLVADALDPLVRDLRDVHQAVAPRKDGDERAEVHEARHLALVDPPDLDVGGDELDAPLRLAARRPRNRGDLHRAVALDVDGGAGLLGDLADDGAALADDVADLLRIDLEGDDGRRPLGHLLARLVDDAVHLAEDVQAAFARLLERDLHDLGRHALDLDVHLTEVILVAEDVGEDLVARALEHQAHRHARHRRLDRHAGVHQRERRTAHARHGARAVRFEDLRHYADHVREGGHVGHHGVHAAPRKIPVADLTPLRRSHHAGLAHRERREVVVQHERLAPLALEAVDDLRIAGGAEGGDDHRLGLAAGEERRAVSARQYTDPDCYRAHGARVAPVDARLAVEDPLAHDVALELEEHALDAFLAVLGVVTAGERG